MHSFPEATVSIVTGFPTETRTHSTSYNQLLQANGEVAAIQLPDDIQQITFSV